MKLNNNSLIQNKESQKLIKNNEEKIENRQFISKKLKEILGNIFKDKNLYIENTSEKIKEYKRQLNIVLNKLSKKYGDEAEKIQELSKFKESFKDKMLNNTNLSINHLINNNNQKTK